MTGRPLAGLLFALAAAATAVAQNPPDLPVWGHLPDRIRSGSRAADDAKLPDATTFDKVVVDTLRDIHNRGADLYNTSKDFPGAFRMYEGALRTVRPLLAHRPAAQKLIEEGLAAADKESSPAQKAFKLHETIEAVRKHLKDVGGKPDDKAAKNDGNPPVEVAPPPRDKKTEKKSNPSSPVGAKVGGLSGSLLRKGQPLAAGEVTLVSLDLPKPRVFTAPIGKDGSYAFPEPPPPGRYVVIVTAKGVPEKYSTTTTSGIVIDVKAARSVQDIELQ